MLEKYQSLVNTKIPLTRYMEWNIVSLSPFEILTSSNLTPNINVHGTAYAGSIYAVAMATGWTLLKCWYDNNGFETELVAAEANIKYMQPVESDIECRAALEQNSGQYQKLLSRMKQNRSCAYPLEIEINSNAARCAILEVCFVFKC